MSTTEPTPTLKSTADHADRAADASAAVTIIAPYPIAEVIQRAPPARSANIRFP